MLKVYVKGIKELQKTLNVQGKKQKKALDTAIKVEGFRQLRKLRDDMKKGTPGGRAYAKQLSEIAQRTKTGRLKKNRIPLYKLSKLLRYNVSYVGGNIQLGFGYVGSKARKLSTSWEKLILRHEEGTTAPYPGSSTELREKLAKIGGKLKKKGDPDARFFFLRRTTGRRINIPKRAMIDPHWRRHQVEARKNISRNFARKLAGHRI